MTENEYVAHPSGEISHDDSRVRAALVGAQMMVAYDLALRIAGLNAAPSITEEQALQVYLSTLKLQAHLSTYTLEER
jgi:hypothetical protein